LSKLLKTIVISYHLVLTLKSLLLLFYSNNIESLNFKNIIIIIVLFQ